MARMTTSKPLPSVGAIQAEATRIASMIEAATKRIDSADCNLRTHMHLQVCRAELQAYFAGLMYALGYTDLLNSPQSDPEFIGSTELPSFGDVDTVDEEDVHFVQCFEC